MSTRVKVTSFTPGRPVRTRIFHNQVHYDENGPRTVLAEELAAVYADLRRTMGADVTIEKLEDE